VRLFIIPIRTASPSKSRVEFSVWGEGCDTPSVTVAATMFKQYLTMYPRSLNEILVWLVLNFKFKLFFLFSNQGI
jgi:hypothetical protein